MKKLLTVIVILAGLAILGLMPLPFETTNRVINSVFIARPSEDVFNYVTTPGNWPKWHPSSLAVHGATGHSLHQGERVTEDYRVAGHEGTAEWMVVERNAPHTWRITATVGSRNAGWVRYEVAEENGGSRFTREFLYRPNTLLTVILDRLSIHAKIDAESSQAVRQLKEILEGREQA